MENLNVLKELITELQKIRVETKLLLLKDDMLFDGAVRIYNSKNIDISKKENIKEMKEQPKEKATSNQLAYLQELGYEGNYNITKKEASDIIEKIKGRKFRK
jgi:hypothetical protein